LAATPLKRNIGKNFYHVVIRYDAPGLGDMPVFCSAHSDENRKNAYNALSFITQHGFKKHNVFVPEPLFFDDELKAFFYRGVDGENLLSYIKKTDVSLAPYLDQTAKWIAQLHSIGAGEGQNFNPINSRINTIYPGPEKFLPKIKEKFPKYYGQVKTQFDELAAWEEESLASLPKLHLIHGDLHPENVIINKTDNKVSLIDFTDICTSDWARDVGSFLQQLAFMSGGHRNQEEIDALKNKFTACYFAHRDMAQDANADERIQKYETWTALRSAIYFLTKSPAEAKEAETALAMAQQLSETE
ncbi:MAG: phosphotransferase, partial [bacterium]|nr:phosphotransferase [bacterium]